MSRTVRGTARGQTAREPDDPEADPASVAHTICLNLLTARARSRAELADALGRRGVDDDVAGPVLDRLAEVGLVDDAAFAQQWTDSRRRHGGLGRRALAAELRHKGVEGATVDDALAGIGREDEMATARALVARRLPSVRRLDTVTAARRLVGVLARKGYPAGLAHEVVRDALNEPDAFGDGIVPPEEGFED